MKTTHCYICGSNNSKIKYRISIWNIRHCNTCGFVFVDPKPRDKFLNHYYSSFASNIFEKNKITAMDSKHTLQLLDRYKGFRNELLDIGCGNGIFMFEARKFKWFPVGIDISQTLIKYIKKNTDLLVYKANILDYQSKNKYDLITLNQVIEHFSDPRAVIKKCKNILNKFGLLYIATPNISSYSSRIRKEEFDYIIPPEHLSYFDTKTLAGLLRKSGFKILYIGSWSYPVDLAALIKYLFGKRKTTIKNSSLNEQNYIKSLKYLLFDVLFCSIFYKLLNINLGGTHLEIIARKI